MRIRTLYANSNRASPVTDALMLMYMADWELLFDHRDTALRLYNTAYELVENSKVDSTTLQRWFAYPVIIPSNTFTDTWPQSVDTQISTLRFSAWSSVFPGVQLPELSGAHTRQTVSKYSASARFEISREKFGAATAMTLDANRFSFAISNLEIATVTPHNDLVTRQARQQISELRFRPVIFDNKPNPGDIFYLEYVFAAETDFSMLSDANQ